MDFFSVNKNRAPIVTDPAGLLQKTVAAALPGMTFTAKPTSAGDPDASNTLQASAAGRLLAQPPISTSQVAPHTGPQQLNYYISAINTKRNPDLIIPGGAIKGNMYFRRHVQPAEESSQLEQEPVTTDSQLVNTNNVNTTDQEEQQ